MQLIKSKRIFFAILINQKREANLPQKMWQRFGLMKN